MRVKYSYQAFAYIVIGIFFYILAVLSTFGAALWQHSRLGPLYGPIVMIALISVTGLCAVGLGYVMIRILGGHGSLHLCQVIARLTRSKQIIQIAKPSSNSNTMTRLFRQAHWLYLPGLLFLATTGLGWDFYNGDNPKTGSLQPIFHALNMLSRPPPGTSPIVFSRHLIPALILLTAIAGIVPSLVLPYFVKFKITGINAGPFHTTLLFAAVGALAGLSAIFTLIGLYYRSLFLNRAPLPFHFSILTLLGLSLHFSLGMYIGVGWAEEEISAEVSRTQSGLLVLG